MGKKKEQEQEQAPRPLDRMVRSGSVRVRARQAIGEVIGGDMKRFAAGDEFDCPAERRAALGSLVEDLTAPEQTERNREIR